MGYNEISQPYWQNLVRRVFGLTGPGGNVVTVAPEIQGVAILQPSNEEHRRLRGEDKFEFGIYVTNVGATRAYVGMINPTSSNKVAVIEYLRAGGFDTGGGLCEVVVKIDTATNVAAFLTANQNAAPGDTRLANSGGSPTPAAGVFTGTSAVLSTGFVLDAWRNLSATYMDWHPFENIVLTPGWGILVTTNQAGATFSTYGKFRWYEKLFEPQEATG